jgi:hypothetical protein
LVIPESSALLTFPARRKVFASKQPNVTGVENVLILLCWTTSFSILELARSIIVLLVVTFKGGIQNGEWFVLGATDFDC